MIFFDAYYQKKNKGLIDKFKGFVNTTLGETWKNATKPLEHGSLFSRREHFPVAANGDLLLPRKALALFAGLDMQMTGLRVSLGRMTKTTKAI